MRILFAVVILTILAMPVDARTCEQQYICETAGRVCKENVKSFPSYAEFQKWLDANVGLDYWVIYTSSTVVKIVYGTGCVLSNRCIDAIGPCEPVL